MLSHYESILSGKINPNYIETKRIFIRADLNSSLMDLWKYHEEKKSGSISLLDVKIEIAKRIFKNCQFCEHRCEIDRNEKVGVCRVKNTKIVSEFAHYGEESVLVPSHTIFFSGCSFKCCFCQNWDLSQANIGKKISPEKVAEIIERRNLKNVNFVGGEPTPNLLYILRVLKSCCAKIPVVWNSNMYMTPETMKILDGVSDLYLTDFKYGNSDCAEKYSKIKNYFEIVKRNHLLAEKQTDLIIRHLVMPGHLECCTRIILEWISKNLNSPVNVMFQYRPEYRAFEHEEIYRHLTNEERRRALDYAEEFGIQLV